MRYLMMLLVVGGLGAPGPADAGDVAASAIEAAVDAGFSDLERQMIERYYGDRYRDYDRDGERYHRDDGGRDGKSGKGGKGNLPPGLARRGELPPGLARREVLPPGLAKRDLPDDLEHKLPPPPDGYRRRIVEDVDHAAVVLVHEATGRVADIIKDVIIPREDRD